MVACVNRPVFPIDDNEVVGLIGALIIRIELFG